LLERYQNGEREFAHVDLSGANLSGVNLREVNLSGANLTGVNLSWAFLSRANLTGACLRQADLRSASLNSAKLNQAILSGANLSKADLRMAYLQEADLNWAVLEDADLGGANLQAAKLDQVNLERAKLGCVQMMAAELMEANLRRANLAGANLEQANLREAHLDEANLREVNLVRANLIEANLSGAYLRQSDLTEADLHRVVLSGADLSEANLTGADLSRANLNGAYLLKTSFRKAHLLRASLQDAFLLRADLNEANLRGADLRRADLSGAYLSDAILIEADLTDAFLLESHLIRTNLDGAQLSGCCIYNWHIEEVNLATVKCSYVYTQFNYTSKKPTNRYPHGRDLEPGELGKRHRESSSLVELYFTEAVNWEALVFTLTQVELESPELKLTIHSSEPIEDNYLVKVLTNREINSKVLVRRVFQLYPDILHRCQQKRSELLQLLGIQAGGSAVDGAVETSQSSTNHNRQERIYREVVRQIQHILLSQAPEQFVESVHNLLGYLSREGIPTEEIQKKIIGQVIVQRARKDPVFRENLLRWENSVNETARQSVVGRAVRVAIALLWESRPT